MQYRKDKHGEDLSILGFGCMRFTRKGNGLDLDKAEKEAEEAPEAVEDGEPLKKAAEEAEAAIEEAKEEIITDEEEPEKKPEDDGNDL